jgi:DNA polymerase-3 subunit epsilon
VIALCDVLTLDRPLLGFDLETTGTNPAKARIVELGLEIMIPGRPVTEYRTLVNPGVPIPPAATAVHGITDDMVQGAPTFESLAANLLRGFTGADFAGYNVRFDIRMIQAEFKRAGHHWTYETARVLDGFRLWQVLEPRSLDDAVRHWLPAEAFAEGTDRDTKSHNALWDVKRSTRVIAAQLMAADHLPRNLDYLHGLCAPGWLDAEGKIQWRDGAWSFSFGEHRGAPLHTVPRSYFVWILKKDFSDCVKDVCRAILERQEYPAPPALREGEDE